MFLSPRGPNDVYKIELFDQAGSIDTQILQFLDDSIFNEDGFVYVSIPNAYGMTSLD